MIVTQQRFYGEFMSPATVTRTYLGLHADVHLAFISQIFIEVPNIKFHGNTPGALMRADGQTDRRT